ncbi:MAG: hypothetical protein H7X97_06910 [Opitutaceae bacterium]|nr:hypothetical protein [Verrucomicrobiales bacterium]
MFSGKNLLPAVLISLLLVSAVTAAVFTVVFIQSNRDLRRLQAQAASIQNNRLVAQAMANDCLEYSKRNPAIDPILQSIGLKPKPQAATSPARPTK